MVSTANLHLYRAAVVARGKEEIIELEEAEKEEERLKEEALKEEAKKNSAKQVASVMEVRLTATPAL